MKENVNKTIKLGIKKMNKPTKNNRLNEIVKQTLTTNENQVIKQ